MIPVEANAGCEKRVGIHDAGARGYRLRHLPLNYPLSLSAAQIGPATAAGNTVILKPTQQTPLSGCLLTRLILEAGLPPEHIQLLLGPGGQVGNWLLENQDINFYSLTGSTEVGRHITQTIGLRRCAMELGSNAAVIVHQDADAKGTATACAQRGFYNAGQVCISIQRVYVHEALFPAFVARPKRSPIPGPGRSPGPEDHPGADDQRGGGGTGWRRG
jgi:acyl-CoA reductase-like NAD-dependent aldehyde dehydrogenase